jgi:predicted transcriptional regulator
MTRKKNVGKKSGERVGGERKKPAKRRLKRPSKELLNYRQMFALSKKTRVEVFAIFCERVASPKEISDELGEGLSQISYHVNVLHECRLIAEERRVPRRGAVEHFYRAVTPTLIPPNAWDHLPAALRKRISANILQHFFEDAGASMEAGVFDESPGELSWTPLVLDASGIEELGQLTRDFLGSVLDLQGQANKRLSKGNGEATGATSATVFLASFLSARSPKENKKASATKRR